MNAWGSADPFKKRIRLAARIKAHITTIHDEPSGIPIGSCEPILDSALA